MSVTGGPMGSNFRSYSNSTPDLTDKDFGPTGGMLNKSPVKPENQEVNTQNLVDGLTSDADFYSSHCTLSKSSNSVSKSPSLGIAQSTPNPTFNSSAHFNPNGEEGIMKYFLVIVKVGQDRKKCQPTCLLTLTNVGFIILSVNYFLL